MPTNFDCTFKTDPSALSAAIRRIQAAGTSLSELKELLRMFRSKARTDTPSRNDWLRAALFTRECIRVLLKSVPSPSGG